MIGKKKCLLLAAVATLVLGLYGCGGGSGPQTSGGQPMPEDVDLSSVSTGFMAAAGIVQVAAGQSFTHGDIEFRCASDGADCTVTVEVGADGAVSATSTGGMVTAMNSDAYAARITPMPVDLAPVTAGFVAQAGTVRVAAGQSAVHGDIEFSCAAGGADCEVMVMVDANGDITATSTGGMVTAMNSDAYTAQITPMAVDLAPVTVGFVAGAGTVQVPAGQLVDHGDIAFSCAAGGSDCTVRVEVDANGAITATSTGGDVTAMNSDAYTDRIATMHPVVGKWAGDWPGGARTVLTITSVSADGQVTGTYRHQERGGQPFVLEISPDGPVTASIQNGVLSFSFGQSTFEFTETAEDTLSFAFQFSPDSRMVSVDVNRQDADDIMASDVPSTEALANVIDLVANDSRRDAFGNYVGGWRWRSHNIGAQQAAVTGTYSGGQSVNAIVSHDDKGQLQHNVAVLQINPLQDADPLVEIGRYINTYNAPEELEGVTNSTSTISDHGLGPDWQVTELTADYDNGGTLDIYVASDVQPSDGSQDPFELATEIDYNIKLPGAPPLPADQDFLSLRIDDGDSIEGSLDDVSGSFSCANVGGCFFATDHRPGDYYASSPGVTFTPDGGTPQLVSPRTLGTVPNADYLAFGHWLYVPDDVTDSVNYEFGVFASGGDPFEVSNLAGLTGTATYAGNAVGEYYVDGLSDDPTIGSFTADVTLEADFGDSSATGFIDGEVTNFAFEDDVASSLPATLSLSSDPYSYLSTNFGIPEDSTNIFGTAWSGENAPYPGGHIAAEATASADGENWFGEWHAAFYGNGAWPTDHPTGVAGTFNLSTYDDGKRVDRGLAGSFGAHRYNDGLTRDDPQNYSQPSHDLQASLAQTNWLMFRHSGGSDIAYADFDGDGDEDFFLLSPGRDAEGDQSVCFPDAYCFTRAIPVEIWENVGNSFVLNTQKFFSGNVPEVVNIRKVLIGDFNGDGKPDIFLATHGPAVPPLPRDEPPALFLSTENGLVQAQGLDDLAGYNHGAASADIDLDGDLDIFVTDTANDPYFLINDGNGNFEQNTNAVPPAINDQGVFTAELVDVDDDGYPDLLVGGHEEEEHGDAPTAIYWGNSSGEYSDSSKTILPEVNGQGIVVDIDIGDLDGDGNNDIVVNRTDSDPFYVGYYIQVISGLGNRTFSDTTSQSIGHGADTTGRWIVWLRLVDVNGDGSLDITTDGDRYFGVAWLNDGSGHLAPANQVRRPFLHDWIRPASGLYDTQIREQMDALVRSSDLMIRMDMDSSPTMGPVSGTVDFGSLEHGIGVAYQEIHGLYGVSLAIGYRETGSESFLGYGGWIDHSMFSLAVRALEGGFHADAYSLGVESGTDPVSGSATWNGPVIGVDTTVFERGRTFRGFAEVNIDFANANVDVAFTVMRFHLGGNVVRPDITWNDLPLNAGKFGSDSIQGAFYGSNHEEVGGVFSRDGALGAFGGTRQ